MPLDPIVSLSVALAEAPGACAFFLGSGVSRDAGVPTGYEVMRRGLRQLHRVETGSDETLGDEALDVWLAETDREHITYSELLAEITPDAAIRREYLAGFFETAEPGPTHESLAQLAEDGLVRVFITTNFDRLLEHALQARGIEPVVIASDADMAAAMPREHAPCVVLKLHGDYLRETIRNTPEELAQLEPGITGELNEVFARYGVVVLGYSGSDEAIAEALRRRNSRYGVWWVARGDLAPATADLVDAIGGRIIRRDSAADFLADLRHRLSVFAEHPSGMTPGTTHDTALGLIRDGDEVGLAELLRRERHAYQEHLYRNRSEARARPGNLASVTETWTSLRPGLERFLSVLLPLALYRPETFTAEVERMTRALEGGPLLGGLSVWLEIPQYSATWLGYICGALLVNLDRLEPLGSLLSARWRDVNGYSEPLVHLPGSLSHELGRALVPPPPNGGGWVAPGWEFLHQSVATMDWLTERYPELTREGEPRRSLGQFDVLAVIAAGLQHSNAGAFFTLAGDSPLELASQLYRDDARRQLVAEMLGLTLEEFDAQAPDLVRAAHPFQVMNSATPEAVANALTTGSRY
jgi:hypothetical protein